MRQVGLVVLGIGCLSMLELPMAFAFDAEKALSSFRKCKACHEIGLDAESKVGPHLNGLDGRPASGLDDFAYSKAFFEAAQDGLTWDRDSLDEFIRMPKAFIKGTKMSYAGMRNPDERDNLIRWLLHFSPDGAELADANEKTELLGGSALAIEGDPAYGEYLSGECVTCHRVSGGDSGIPAITGWPKENFIHALYEYKERFRDNPVMQTVTARLGDEEMAALAAYFGTLPAQ